MLLIHHATVLTPQRQIDDGAVLTEGQRIVAVGRAGEVARPAGARSIDASGLTLVPGFVDLQINGAFGHDFTADPASIWQVGAQLPCYGVTSFLPTIITSPLETVNAAREVVLRAPASRIEGAIPLGLHVEGPFLNPQKRGAHNPSFLRPADLAAIQDWSPDRGVRLVTLAPELPGALDLVATLVRRGIAVSAGHSSATYAQAEAGFAAGIRYGTHLFNAMPPLHHREPGLVGALLSDPRPVVGMIVDGIHIHPSLVRLVWRILGSACLNLVTDAMAALGVPPGRHRLGDLDVWVDGTSAHLEDGTLAGSVLSLDAALRNLIQFSDCSLVEALPTVTTTPAQVLGLSDWLGHIAPGHVADMVLLTPDLQVHTTVAGGKVVYSKKQDGASLAEA